MNARATNNALLKLLGITEPLITALQIQMRPTNLPVVTMEYLLDGKALEPTAAQFDLVLREEAALAPAPAPALDLNAMCAATSATLASEVDFHATTALTMHRRESSAILARLDRAIRVHQEDTATAMLRTQVHSWISALSANGGVFAGAWSGLSSFSDGGRKA